MAGKNLSPRQQMIGLMYLVLLAMLAMNASKDLLNAFLHLEHGIELSSENFDHNNKQLVDKIAIAAATGSQKAKENLILAEETVQKGNELVALIQQYKNDLIELGGGLDDHGYPKGKDNQDIGAQYIIFKQKGKALKDLLNSYENFLLKQIDSKEVDLISSIKSLLKTPEYVDYEGNKFSWEYGLAEHLPLVAVTANLTNIQTYIRNASAQVLAHLQETISLDSYKVNKILASVNSSKNYILSGDSFTAEIFLAAADTTQEPIILIGNYDEDLFKQQGELKFFGAVDTLQAKQGKGKYSLKTQNIGEHHWGGIMRVPHPNPKKQGTFLDYPFKNTYVVAQPNAVVSSVNMQIMYLKIDNLLEVSAPGINSDAIELRANGNVQIIKKTKGVYSVIPQRLGTVELSVVYTNPNNPQKTTVLSTKTWVTKRLPKPELTLLGKALAESLNKNELKVPNNEFFKAAFPPAFPINEEPKVKEVTVSIVKNGNFMSPDKLNVGVFTPQFKSKIMQLQKGDKMEIEAKVATKDGVTHTLRYYLPIL